MDLSPQGRSAPLFVFCYVVGDITEKIWVDLVDRGGEPGNPIDKLSRAECVVER